MIGFTIATVGVFSLITLTPDSPYWHEAIIMAFVGIGLGTGMPIMNLAVQNEFEQRDLGAATASSQLFRGLGSTIGTAVLGSILTVGVTASLDSLQNDSYVSALKQQPVTRQMIGDTLTTDTALLLNSSDVRRQISDGFDASLGSKPIPTETKDRIRDDFAGKQEDFGQKVETSFSDSLHGVFLVSGVLMALATVAAGFIEEKPLRGGQDDTPGLA